MKFELPKSDSEFPKESIPGDRHTLTTNGKKYDVYKLIHLTQEILPTEIETASLEKLLSSNCWKDLNWKKMSPKQILDAYRHHKSLGVLLELYPEWRRHIIKMEQVDLSKAILMCDGDILDGMHRVLWAVIKNIPTIPVKFLDKIPEEAVYKE